MLTAINNVTVITKSASKIKKFRVLQVSLFSLKFVEIVFVSSIISAHIITESSIILAKYSPFLQLCSVELQLQSF